MTKLIKCPYCAEEILDEAIKCKHCSEWLQNEKINSKHYGKWISDKKARILQSITSFKMTRKSAFLLSWLGSVLFSLAFIILLSPFENKISRSLEVVLLVIHAVGFIAIRVGFARWYVSDKHRNSAWVIVSLWGLIGWAILGSLEDRSKSPIIIGKY